ncbi:MAG: hypothetical protein RMJ55_20325, partial [Roseiflexaceae bacterium]|nr:hypothetical protein [Roseiflexaceae bacterium]
MRRIPGAFIYPPARPAPKVAGYGCEARLRGLDRAIPDYLLNNRLKWHPQGAPLRWRPRISAQAPTMSAPFSRLQVNRIPHSLLPVRITTVAPRPRPHRPGSGIRGS